MSRGLSSTHTLPPNPVWIEFTGSDGDATKWPKNTQKVVDEEGLVNWMRPVAVDESISIKWRRDIGMALAQRLNRPAGPNYVLKSWPEGYQMFDHNKGAEDNPRHDAYLIGSAEVNRFRSIPEFIPHALWLMQDASLNRANCCCKYCGRKPQREITGAMGLVSSKRSTPVAVTSAHASGSGPAKQTKVRERFKPYANVRKTPKPAKLSTGPKQSITRERNHDLRSAYGSDINHRRWFREGEVLWCALKRPIHGKTIDSSISFWPGIVEEVKLKTEAIPKDEDHSTLDIGVKDSSTQAEDAAQDENEPVPWTIKQSTLYKMKFLGIDHTFYVADNQVLPYQAYAPSVELIQAIQEVPIEELDISPKSISAFNPCPPPSGDLSVIKFQDAVPAFSFAIQIAASVAGFWTPTDDWEFKYTIAPYFPPYAIQNTAEVPSLHSVMAASMSYNSALTDAVLNQNFNGSISAPSGSSFTSQPLVMAQTITQTRYQGLWWGGERIWTDELVRLKVARRQIAPEGAENIFRPAGPSKSAMENAIKLGTNDGLGASERGIFLRLDGLVVMDVSQEEGQDINKECRATGMLYELVDADWEEPNLEAALDMGQDKAKSVDGNNGVASAETTEASNNYMNGKDGSSYAPVLSPSKPFLLPNPDPAVPVESTTSDVIAQTLPPTPSMAVQAQSLIELPSQSQQKTANDHLSHPIASSPYALPDPPHGYKFRPILSPGYEAVISLTLISGRYYPGLLSHPLVLPAVARALLVPPEEGGVNVSSHLWALDGLAPGCYNAVDPTKWKPSRLVMMKEATKEARAELQEHWEAKARERKRRLSAEQSGQVMKQMPEAEAMDVDAVA